MPVITLPTPGVTTGPLWATRQNNGIIRLLLQKLDGAD